MTRSIATALGIAALVVALDVSPCIAEPGPAPGDEVQSDEPGGEPSATASPSDPDQRGLSRLRDLVTAENEVILLNVQVELRIESLQVVYDVSLMNKSNEPISLPPITDSSRTAYLGVAPFWSAWLLIGDKWVTYYEASPIEGDWLELAYAVNSTLFTGLVSIRPGHEIKRGSGEGGTPLLVDVPSMPRRMRLRFPYRWMGNEEMAEFEVALKSIDDHLQMLGRARSRIRTSDEPLPPDVQAYLERRRGCEHFIGEEPFDEARRQFLHLRILQACSGINEQGKATRELHRDKPNVRKLLEGHSEPILLGK